MSKKQNTDIENLINHSHKISPSIHDMTIINNNDSFAILLNDHNKNIYKAYARFAEFRLSKKNEYSKLLKIVGDFIKEDRLKRQFEIYLYSPNINSLHGLYHYYLKTDSLEKLPDINLFDAKKIFINSSGKKIKLSLMITLSLSSLPNNNKNWWYRKNILELGRLTEIILNFTKTHKIDTVATDFYDEEINNFLNINGNIEAVVQCLNIYSK
jgi:hypothetical protein